VTFESAAVALGKFYLFSIAKAESSTVPVYLAQQQNPFIKVQ